jgi:2-dehydro-3-deoxygalactonokinase
VPVELENDRKDYIIPGLFCEPAPGGADVIRGEETPSLGTGVENGLICSAGTHPKWILMRWTD